MNDPALSMAAIIIKDFINHNNNLFKIEVEVLSVARGILEILEKNSNLKKKIFLKKMVENLARATLPGMHP